MTTKMARGLLALSFCLLPIASRGDDPALPLRGKQAGRGRPLTPASLDAHRRASTAPVLVGSFDTMSRMTVSGAAASLSPDRTNRVAGAAGMTVSQSIPSRSSLSLTVPIGTWTPADLGTVAVWVDRRTEGNIVAENMVIGQGATNFQVSFQNEQNAYLPGGHWLAANISEFPNVAALPSKAPMTVKISFNQQPPYGASGTIDGLFVRAAGRPTLVPVFDDATIETFTNVYPILSKMGLKATVAVPINYVGRKDRMSWQQLQQLYAAGWDMACNTTNDQPATDPAHFPTTQSVVDDFERCRNALMAHGIGRAASQVDWSNGAASDAIAKALQSAGFLSMRGTEPQTFFTRFGIGAGAVKRMPSTGFRSSSVAAACTAVVDQVVRRGTTGFYTIHDVSNTPSSIGFRLPEFTSCAQRWHEAAASGAVDILTWSEFWARDGHAKPPGGAIVRQIASKMN